MDKIDLKGMGLSELENFAVALGLKKFRGRQIFRWINQEGLDDFEPMSDIGKPVKAKLAQEAMIGSIITAKSQTSSDGTIKYLFQLSDGHYIESVLIPDKGRLTLCVSSQAGCPVGCQFCATGQFGYQRNLSSGEIVDQFLKAQKSSGQRISNIVFMGMGEPMLNLENVLGACRILNDDYGPAVSQKKITISTVGIVAQMKKFIPLANKLGLAISLHSADEGTRQRIIPAARKNSLTDILAAAKQYTEQRGRRVSFEYLLLGGINDSIADARNLVRITDGIPCKINLIRFNPVKGMPFQRPSEENVIKFRDYLYPRTYAVTIRESRGIDIQGACGQLAAQSHKSAG